jgi:exopolysaccharide biosynthesis polyprenyl glycosylphosphotransferase
MVKRHANAVYYVLLVADVWMTVLSFYSAYWFRNTFLGSQDMKGLYPLERYTWLLIVIIPAWIILLKIFNAYRFDRTVPIIDELLAVGKAAVLGGFLVGTIAFAMKAGYLSRVFILSFIVFNFIFLGAERYLIRVVSSQVRNRGYNSRNVVIVGSGGTARDIAERINSYQAWGLRLVGFVLADERAEQPASGDLHILGKLPDLEGIVQSEMVDEVIFAVSGKKLEDLEDTLLMLEERGINARIVANIFPHVIAKMRVEELETIPLLTFSTAPSNTVALSVKRIFDVIISFGIIVLSSPVMLVIAMAIKATSNGPILFKQKRLGLHGRTFTLYKFRSMYNDAETRRKDLEKYNEMGGPVFKMKDDPRITPLGRYMRRMSVDELPQLWNVVKGNMSLVGPRPPVPEEVEKYQRWQRRRLSMRPGITCLWQISGRNEIRDFNEWVKLDLQYIDTWSLALDLKILLKTIPTVLFQKGAV